MTDSKKKFPVDYYLINDILMEWNPVNAFGTALMDEYTTYIPRLMKVKMDRNAILDELKHILTRDLGIDLDENQLSSLTYVANKIYDLAD